MSRLGKVQRAMLEAIAVDTIAYQRTERHSLWSNGTHNVYISYKWEGGWSDATVRSIVRRGLAAYQQPGRRVVGLGITREGRRAIGRCEACGHVAEVSDPSGRLWCLHDIDHSEHDSLSDGWRDLEEGR